MVRAPCCEKMGLKKGPWSNKEDEILVSYIKRYGHGNWRALPKQAGLLRCGKSCRLRWLNYLRPDIKRGNFSKEEDETIVKLHKIIGNRWSLIASKLPGRTDNEIKNYWRFHLKKRILQQNVTTPTSRETKSCTRKLEGIAIRSHQMAVSFTTNHGSHYNSSLVPILPQEYSSQEVPNSMTKINTINNLHNMKDDMKFWYDLLVKAERSRDA